MNPERALAKANGKYDNLIDRPLHVGAFKLFLHMLPWLVALLALFGLLRLSQFIRK